MESLQRSARQLARPITALCPIPADLDAVTVVGDEAAAGETGVGLDELERLWQSTVGLYRTGLYPAVQVCIRHRGGVVLHRALGHSHGGGPDDPPDGPVQPVSLETPFLLYSASKAITAMMIHKLDEQGRVHLDDRVCEYIPEFARHRKHWITLRHLLGHKAGIPNLPPEAMDLDLLEDPSAICELLCELEPVHGAGRRQAYHAVSGGFVLGEVVQRVTGESIRALMRKEVCEPLDFRWMNFGVDALDVGRVARDACTGPPLLPPLSWLLTRALGTTPEGAVELACDPRFLTGVIPAANVISTASELCAFYECLLREGELDGVRVFDPRSVRHATSEQSYQEIDLTLGLPIRYGMGMMLGGRRVGLFGLQTPRAFGHVGFTNIFGWADPDRDLAVAILTSGKPLVSLGSVRLVDWLLALGRTFPAEVEARRST